MGGTGTNCKRIRDTHLHNTNFFSNPSLFWSYFLPLSSARAEQASSPLHVRETSEFGASCLRNLSTGDLPFLSPIPGFWFFLQNYFNTTLEVHSMSYSINVSFFLILACSKWSAHVDIYASDMTGLVTLSVHFPWSLPVWLFSHNCLKAWHLCGWQPMLTMFLWLLSVCRGYAILHMVTHLHCDNSCWVTCWEFPAAALHEEPTRTFIVRRTPDTCVSPQRGTWVRHFHWLGIFNVLLVGIGWTSA